MSDDSTQMIKHMISNHDFKGYIKDVLHISAITKNLVLIG
mgnify:CR=1 FL=1